MGSGGGQNSDETTEHTSGDDSQKTTDRPPKDSSDAAADRQSENSGWLHEIENWDEQSRRGFLALLAAVSGVIGAVVLYSERMLKTTQIEEPTEDAPTDVYVQEYETEYRAIDRDGEVLDSDPDGWSVLDTAIREIPEGGTLYVRGRYVATSTIEIFKSLQIDGHGASIDLQESTADLVFDISGEERHQTELTADIGTGDHTVELEQASEIEPGDLLLLEETDGAPVLGRGQPPGEPHSVLEVEDDTVTLEDTVVWRDGYDAGTLVYVIDPIEVRCSGFEMEGPAKRKSNVGIMARNCRNSVFEELTLDKFGNRGIALEGCANSRIRDCTVLQSADIDAGDGYGIQIRAGCHDIVVEGCTAKECRHPFSVTPAGPREVASRSIVVRDGFFSSDGSAALNCHGGSAHDIKFKGCMVHTWGEPGVRTGAQKTNVSGCEFRMDGHHAVTTRNDGQEMVLTVTDTDIYGATNAVGLSNGSGYEFEPLWKLAHIEGVRAHGCNRFFELESGEIDRVRNLIISNCSWDTVGEGGIRIENTLDGGSIEGNSFGDAPNESHIRVRGGDHEVKNLQISGNRFQNGSGTHTFIRMANASKCVISDNKFESESGVDIYSNGPNSASNLIKQNTYFGPRASVADVSEDAESIATDNYFLHTE